jgi:antitoxin component YwqK of YwqJK toxin-antitoxin module
MVFVFIKTAMRYFLNIFIFLCLCKNVLAYEVIKDTVVAQKMFHVIIHNDDTNKTICVGCYVPHTYIRQGEWDYFYADGKLYSKAFFKLDDKTGIWVYYDEQGNITKQIKPCKKHHSFIDYYANKDDDDAIMDIYYRRAQQNSHACVMFSSGSVPLEYDEKIHQQQVNMMIHNMGRIQGDNSYFYKEIRVKSSSKKHQHKHKKYARY